MLSVVSCGYAPEPYTCQADTPNLDRITAALDQMDATANRLATRVHNIESEIQTESLWAAVHFIEEGGWSLSVLAPDGVVVHEWGAIASECVRPCIDTESYQRETKDCRSIPVGTTGMVLCGSREVQ
jgi:hypothetical protein